MCGEWYDCQQVLEYHHLVPELKEHDISNLLSRPWEEVKAELDKCVVLCANCHREVHAGYTNLEDYL